MVWILGNFWDRRHIVWPLGNLSFPNACHLGHPLSALPVYDHRPVVKYGPLDEGRQIDNYLDWIKWESFLADDTVLTPVLLDLFSWNSFKTVHSFSLRNLASSILSILMSFCNLNRICSNENSSLSCRLFPCLSNILHSQVCPVHFHVLD